MRLDGRTVVVTGAASGIGAAAAALFASEGAVVVCVDLDRATTEAIAGRVDGIAVWGDVSAPDTWAAVVDAVPVIDIAYLNAGVFGFHGPIDDLPLDLYHRTTGTNIDGVVLGVRAVVPTMRTNGGGAIVVTASVAGIVAFEGNPIYTLTKQAVVGFVRAVAPSLVADGITIDAVCPGVVDTPMTVEAMGGATPSDRGVSLINPTAIAAAALDLATTPGSGRCRAVRADDDVVDWVFPTWRDLAQAR